MNNKTNKPVKSNVAANIERILPMIDEISNGKYFPFCIIGAKQIKKEKKINFLFSTILHDDETYRTLYYACKEIIEVIENETNAIKNQKG